MMNEEIKNEILAIRETKGTAAAYEIADGAFQIIDGNLAADGFHK